LKKLANQFLGIDSSLPILEKRISESAI
jgi:hypothetical protein